MRKCNLDEMDKWHIVKLFKSICLKKNLNNPLQTNLIKNHSRAGKIAQLGQNAWSSLMI